MNTEHVRQLPDVVGAGQRRYRRRVTNDRIDRGRSAENWGTSLRVVRHDRPGNSKQLTEASRTRAYFAPRSSGPEAAQKGRRPAFGTTWRAGRRLETTSQPNPLLTW